MRGKMGNEPRTYNLGLLGYSNIMFIFNRHIGTINKLMNNKNLSRC